MTCSLGIVELEGNVILASVIGFMWIVHIWETYLTLRQRKVYNTAKKVPFEISGQLDAETFEKARIYQLEKTNFELVQELFGILQSSVILVLGGLPFLWNFSADWLQSQGYNPLEYEILCTAIFSFLGACVSTVTNMPWIVYSTFVIEQKHGFNKQTPGFFIKDQLKQFVLLQAISLPVVSGLIYIIKMGGQLFFVYCWGFVLAVSLVMITIYPDYIAPLFDKFTPLPEGELRAKIEALAADLSFPLKKLFVVEGSKRSSHSNAYFYGFFKNKRIVLFDTLLEDYQPVEDNSTASDPTSKAKETTAEQPSDQRKKGCNDDEVVAVLAHELGHWYFSHVLKHFLFGQVNILLSFAGFAYLMNYPELYRAFGFYNQQPTIIGLLIIFSYIFAPYNEVANFVQTIITRMNEFQADDFGRKLGKAELLKSALIKLHKDNLGFPLVDWLYSTWNYSHPPLLERLAALDKSK